MDADALAALEFDAILERLAAVTATPRGLELALALVPSGDASEVGRRQALTAEAVGLLDEAAEPPLHGIHDVREAVAHAARGGTLTADALARVGQTVGGGQRARAALEGTAEVAPELAQLAAEVSTQLSSLAAAIGGAVEEDGSDLRDTASPLLRKLRREVREGRQRVTEALRKLARSTAVAPHLQEDFVTERGGRPVLAVKASSRSAVKGIVHDASGSGQTLFVEPFEVVELNNRHSEALAEEREEAERILRELSAAVGESADALVALVEATARIDLAVARGSLSRSWRGAPVTVSDEVRLLGARHPLLDPAGAVPIDLDLGDLCALVLSGPNTGGKTVALKTLGLAVLLHQAGLRPPAEQAELPIFDAVLADIGDQQSIAMSLSTFSGHVRNLREILERATPHSLVLVDELASGTDPIEGSALAQALLARLAEQARLTVVTTHYAELKEWASATEGAANAATGIDPETHEPLYRIALGRPGTSHALATAERLGLDAAVVQDARGRVSPERLRVADLVAEAEAAERAAASERDAATAARVAADEQARAAEARESELQAEVERVRASVAEERERAAAEARAELAAARAELDALRKEIRAARRRDREARHAVPDAARERDRRLGAASTRAARAEDALRQVAEPQPLPLLAPLAVGDPVEAPGLGVRGTIATISGDEAEVVGTGGHRIRIALDRLRPDANRAPAPSEPPVRVLAAARGDVGDELDVRGRSGQEAREAVRSFVDDAALAGLPSIRVIHGRGTGAVRKAVRDELAKHPLVAAQESDSADGATVVTLAG